MSNSISIDIEIDEILDNMTNKEKINLFEELLNELDADKIKNIMRST